MKKKNKKSNKLSHNKWNGNDLILNSNIYLMIITMDCVLRLWQLNVNMIGWKPKQILKTNFNALIIK